MSKPLRAAGWLAAVPVAGRLVPAMYDLIWPGPRPSAVARTKLIDDTVGEIVSGGVGQVALLGAGFDSGAWRLNSLAQATVIEVDQAETQASKISALRRAGRDTGPGHLRSGRLRAGRTRGLGGAPPAWTLNGRRCSYGKESRTT